MQAPTARLASLAGATLRNRCTVSTYAGAVEQSGLARVDSGGATRTDLPICDPHHHLWDMRATRVSERYLLDEVLEDIGSGHNVVSTVFIECGAMYRADGPEALGPVGEIEFVNGIAAMSASGLYGPARVAAGIVGTADLSLGDAVQPVLDMQIAVGAGRFRGIRRSAAWDSRSGVPLQRTNPGPGLFQRDDFAPDSNSWRRAT